MGVYLDGNISTRLSEAELLLYWLSDYRMVNLKLEYPYKLFAQYAIYFLMFLGESICISVKAD